MSPSPPSRHSAGAERRAARRRHVRQIRLRVAGFSLATFLAASGAVLAQLVTGHDPALADGTATAHARPGASMADASGAAADPRRPAPRAVSPSPVTTRAS